MITMTPTQYDAARSSPLDQQLLDAITAIAPTHRRALMALAQELGRRHPNEAKPRVVLRLVQN